MNSKYEVTVEHSKMLTVFAGSNLELPFRFQPYVSLILPFEEYKIFCSVMLTTKVFCMWLNKNIYQDALRRSDNKLLRRLYYYDVSKVVMDEIMLAASLGLDGTVFLHSFDKCPLLIELEDCRSELFKLPSKLRQKALDSISKDMLPGIGYAELSEHNKRALNYAVYIRAISYTADPVEFNFM